METFLFVLWCTMWAVIGGGGMWLAIRGTERYERLGTPFRKDKS